MDPDTKRVLDEIYVLTKENHRILSSIRRWQWLSLIEKIVIWIIVLALPLYLYQHYLQPLVTKFSETTGTPTTGFFGLPTSADIQKLVDSFKAKQ
jgi:Trk-type K+ transport system membrane component